MATTAPQVLSRPVQPAGTNAAVATDIRGVKPPVELGSGWLGWILLGAALAAALAAFWWWRRRRPARKASKLEIVIPPYRRALERLRGALLLVHQPERFCVAVSDSVRVYLEERFNLRAPERTTEEFLGELQGGTLLTDGQRALLGDLLVRCDLVKFAREEPGEPELRGLYDSAVRLVEETEPLLNPQLNVGSVAAGAAPAGKGVS